MKGVNYCVKIFVSLAGNWNQGTDGTGAYFSQDSRYYSSPSSGVLNLPAPVQNPSGNIIIDTVNWALTKVGFVAVVGERYLTTGNFKNDANTQTISQGMAYYSYFYIDDVSVTEGSCNVGKKSQPPISQFSYHQTPVKDYFQIIVPEKNFSNLKYKVYSIDGSRVEGGVLQRNHATVHCGKWNAGIYFIQVYDEDGNTLSVKVLKNE